MLQKCGASPKYRGEKMRDSAKLLNFNLDRDLNFDAYRGVNIDVHRSLHFDKYRSLSFDLDRDLGFGKRGIIFRGYVCPACKAPVDVDASKCDGCGVRFQKEKKSKSIPKENRIKRKSPARKIPKKKTKNMNKAKPKTAPARKIRDTFRCPICGIPLYVGTAACPGCGLMFGNSANVRNESRIPRDPPKKNRPGR